jgi:hypothetical protein
MIPLKTLLLKVFRTFVKLEALSTATGNHKFRGSFEVIGSVNKKIMVFGNVTQCNLVERY